MCCLLATILALCGDAVVFAVALAPCQALHRGCVNKATVVHAVTHTGMCTTGFPSHLRLVSTRKALPTLWCQCLSALFHVPFHLLHPFWCTRSPGAQHVLSVTDSASRSASQRCVVHQGAAAGFCHRGACVLQPPHMQFRM